MFPKGDNDQFNNNNKDLHVSVLCLHMGKLAFGVEPSGSLRLFARRVRASVRGVDAVVPLLVAPRVLALVDWGAFA